MGMGGPFKGWNEQPPAYPSWYDQGTPSGGIFSPIPEPPRRKRDYDNYPPPFPEEPKVENANPNPSRFNVLNATEIGDYLVAEVHYPDCTNFEGVKIMLFKGVTKAELLSWSEIDPHFDRDRPCPIARFAPSEEGRALALWTAEMKSLEGN